MERFCVWRSIWREKLLIKRGGKEKNKNSLEAPPSRSDGHGKFNCAINGCARIQGIRAPQTQCTRRTRSALSLGTDRSRAAAHLHCTAC